jgi:hypothetical protein
MRRRIFLITIVLIVLFIAGAILWLESRPIASVRLIPDREWRVLKVSFGTNHSFTTESFWKRSLRSILPESLQKPLGAWQGTRFETSHDALVVWIGEFHARTGQPQKIFVSTPETVLPDGFRAGAYKHAAGNLMALEFRWFDREAKQITFRVHDGSIPITFTIDNPHPTRRAVWKPMLLPQTNRVRGTDIVLRDLKLVRGADYEAAVFARALPDGGASWMEWRLTAFDPSGNWVEGARALNWNTRPRIAFLPTQSTIWKFVVDGSEYIPTAVVSMPTNGFALLPIKPRLQRAGVKFLMLASAGVYQITNGVVWSGTNAPSTNQVLSFAKTSGTSNWILHVSSPSPVLLCAFEPSDEGQILRSRLRERLPADGGRIFFPTKILSATNWSNGGRQLAQLCAMRLLPATTNLELEIIRALPPAEFFIPTP